jgi:hypothetical protein
MKHLWGWLVVSAVLVAAGGASAAPEPDPGPAPAPDHTAAPATPERYRPPSRGEAPDFRVLSDTRPPNPNVNLLPQSLPGGAAIWKGR